MDFAIFWRETLPDTLLITNDINILDFKLSPYSECWCFLLGNSQALNYICRRFGTLCLFHLHRSCGQDDLRRWNGESVQKLQHIKSRRRGITQKKECNKLIVAFRNSATAPTNFSTFVLLNN